MASAEKTSRQEEEKSSLNPPKSEFIIKSEPIQQSKKVASEKAAPTVYEEDDEPVIDNFDYAAFLDRHYVCIEPGIHRMNYKYAELKTVAVTAMNKLKNEPTLIDVRAPLFAVGDIHGQFNDLINMFILLGKPPSQRYIFLGDFVDRGGMSLECIMLLLSYKILYPNHVYLLRGNHECARVNRKYGFFEEIDTIFPPYISNRIWALFQRVFNVLPVGGIIEKKILCMHGGLSPFSLEEIRDEKKPIRNPSKGVVNDFLWSDPLHDILFWRTSSRGSGFSFGEQVVDEVCETNGLELILRAHQLCMDGFWSFGKDRKLMTIFSAPAYCNIFRNASAVLKIDENLHCQLCAFVPDSPTARDMIESRKTLWEPEPQTAKPSTGSNSEIKRPLPQSCT